MRKIKDILPKPSDAIQAMIDGLEEQSERPKFQIEMSTFGEAGAGDVCFGCAATCTIQHAFEHNFTVDEIEGCYNRSEALNVDEEDLDIFEDVIDGFRQGYAFRLLNYYGIRRGHPNFNDLYTGDWNMMTFNWKSEIPKVKAYLEQLKTLGL